jgi:hypothetical protein
MGGGGFTCVRRNKFTFRNIGGFTCSREGFGCSQREGSLAVSQGEGAKGRVHLQSAKGRVHLQSAKRRGSFIIILLLLVLGRKI